MNTEGMGDGLACESRRSGFNVEGAAAVKHLEAQDEVPDSEEASSKATDMVQLAHDLAMCFVVLMTIQELVREEVPATDDTLATRLVGARR